MVLRFASGSVDAFERVEEAVALVGVDQRDVVVVAEEGDDLLGLALAHQAGVDEDAGELVADRLVDQDGRDRRIDAAGEAADDLRLADPGADRRDGLVLVGGHRPVAGEAGEVGEVLQDPGAVDRVVHLGVEHHGVEVAARVGGDREGGARRGADHREAGGELGHPVAVAHPDLLAAGGEEAGEQRVGGLGRGDVGAAELGGVAGFDLAAELGHHRLLAVADAEHRDAEGEDFGRGAGAACVDDRGRAAGEDDGLRGGRRRGRRRRPSGRGGSRSRCGASRRRRAISWVTWLPKSTIRRRWWSGVCVMPLNRVAGADPQGGGGSGASRWGG